jgi:hypothetical protein
MGWVMTDDPKLQKRLCRKCEEEIGLGRFCIEYKKDQEGNTNYTDYDLIHFNCLLDEEEII